MRLRRFALWSAAGISGLALAGAATLESSGAVEASGSSVASYEIDPVHSTVMFRVKHGGATNFYGRFNRIDVGKSAFSFDPENPSAGSFSFVISNASIDTGDEGRDNHLKTADFFNVAQFPTTSFKSTSIEAKGEDMFELKGDLSLHGETNPVTVELKWLGEGNFRGPIVAFEAKFEFKRSEFGMTKYLAEDEGDGGLLGNTVGILISVEARPKG